MSPILILGAGPSGLLAAHAAQRAGYEDIVIVSKQGRKSRLYGCQYLHNSIPGIHGKYDLGRAVEYRLIGEPEDYARKVYGDSVPGGNLRTSVDEYGPDGEHLAWNLRTAYDALWDRFENHIEPFTLEGPDEAWALVQHLAPAVTFSTIPAPTLCYQPDVHFFNYQQVWAVGDAPDQDISAPYRAEPFTVLCNAELAPRWYRAANVFDYCTVEWPHHPRPPQDGVAEVVKPLDTNCDCLPQVHRLGRYGKWQKGYLVHQAYEEAYRTLERGVQLRVF